ncbi:MAG TPA: hypothetical protein VJM08_05735 [Anaerolineales bacterium]|nr:hypothetical protein [Anaerolineales bacterium]
MKRIFPSVILSFVLALTLASTAVAAPTPVTTITLVQGLPVTMSIGETRTVIIQVESDLEFNTVQALPSFMFPGKGVVAVQGGDRAGRGTSATLEVTFQAKSSTANFPGGVAPVHVVVGVRYAGGFVAVQDFQFNVTVP